ncbi:MAG: two-component system alkaline phosphatase synthesis response regulator PhoP [Salibacteraceae bacterium]|jgi:two-component system alkaline phosphatase synthesis response regulator PhoP
MKNHKILLVDDDPDILEFIEYNLAKEGFEVATANNGVEAIKIAQSIIPDLILLDVMMPEMDGVETCTKIREIESIKNTRIAFLTARGEDYSQIAGFDAGGDDYILKPVKPRVLVSRIKALLRRNGGQEEAAEPEAGIKIDRERYEVHKDGERFSLPRKEFELLALLMSKSGKVFTREVILSSVWGEEVVVGDRTIDVHIRKLREKLGSEFITTIKGVGYKFSA